METVHWVKSTDLSQVSLPGSNPEHAQVTEDSPFGSSLFWETPTLCLCGLRGIWEAGQHPDFYRSAGWQRWLAAQAVKNCVWLQCILSSDWLWCWQGPRGHSEALRLRTKSLSQSCFAVTLFPLFFMSFILPSFSVRSFSFQLCCCCRCGTRTAGGSRTWV